MSFVDVLERHFIVCGGWRGRFDEVFGKGGGRGDVGEGGGLGGLGVLFEGEVHIGAEWLFKGGWGFVGEEV